MPRTISQRELRNDNAEIMRQVEAGESFVVTRNGKPIADLVPHAAPPQKRKTGRDMQEEFRQLPGIARKPTGSSATTASSTDVPPAALYDTSVVIDVEKVDLGVYLDGAVVVSAVTLGELAYGIGTGDRDAREQRLRRVLASYEIVPFGVEEAKFYGVLAELVRIAGRNPRPRRLDLQIAATAAATRLPLLTMNPDDFVGVGTLVDVVPIRRSG